MYLAANRKNFQYWFYVCIVALITVRVMHMIHLDNFVSLTKASYGVLIGEPHWIAYQNRLLGPFLVDIGANLLHINYGIALKFFYAGLTFIEFIILYKIFLALTNYNYQKSFQYIIFFMIFLLGVQHHWSYPWDYIDLIIFTVFSYVVFNERNLKSYLLLFFIGLLNRESALFIALFIIIDSFKIDISKFSVKLEYKSKLIIGIALMIVGALYIDYIRHLLFIKSSLPRVGGDLDHLTIGNHIVLFKNIRVFVSDFISLNIIVPIFYISLSVWTVNNIKNFTQTEQKLALFILILLIAVFIFGRINETRMYTVLIPLILVLHLTYTEKRESHCTFKIE